jgi:hypothetical protein
MTAKRTQHFRHASPQPDLKFSFLVPIPIFGNRPSANDKILPLLLIAKILVLRASAFDHVMHMNQVR